MHGPTFMGNPLACAVASASIELLFENDWHAQVIRISKAMQALTQCMQLDDVQDVRILGAIGVVEVNRTIDVAKIQKFFISQGLWIRPFGKLIYIMPPYTTSDQHITALCTGIYAAIAQQQY